MIRSVRRFFLTSSLVSRYKGEDKRMDRRRLRKETTNAWNKQKMLVGIRDRWYQLYHYQLY